MAESGVIAGETVVSSGRDRLSLAQAPLTRLRSVNVMTDLLATSPHSASATLDTWSVPQSRNVAFPQPAPTPSESGLAERFIPLQHWIGTVHSRRGDEVVAVLRDWGNPDMPDEEVVLSADEFSPDDQRLLLDGAVFYWTIGYRTQAGTRERVSSFYVRRRPRPSRAQCERAAREARALSSLLGASRPNPGPSSDDRS